MLVGLCSYDLSTQGTALYLLEFLKYWICTIRKKKLSGFELFLGYIIIFMDFEQFLPGVVDLPA